MKPRTRYGILDDFGEVIRWVWSKPAKHYMFIAVLVKIEPAVDWNDFEAAMF